MSEPQSNKSELEKPKYWRDQLIQGLTLGLSMEDARRYAGVNKKDVQQKYLTDVTLRLELFQAIAEGEAAMLFKLREDSHWQSWRIVLEHRRSRNKERREAARSTGYAEQDPSSDDPMIRKVDEVMELIEPGQEDDALECLRAHAMRIRERKYVESKPVPNPEEIRKAEGAIGPEQATAETRDASLGVPAEH
jgi:hypothetical protein